MPPTLTPGRPSNLTMEKCLIPYMLPTFLSISEIINVAFHSKQAATIGISSHRYICTPSVPIFRITGKKRYKLLVQHEFQTFTQITLSNS
jgi:hypothetical protein